MIHRITERRDFERLRDGRRASGRYVWIRHLADQDCNPARVAFAIGRQHGSAVRRNRIRRRLRAALSSPEVHLPPGLHLLGWRHRGDEPGFQDLVDDVELAVARASRT